MADQPALQIWDKYCLSSDYRMPVDALKPLVRAPESYEQEAAMVEVRLERLKVHFFSTEYEKHAPCTTFAALIDRIRSLYQHYAAPLQDLGLSPESVNKFKALYNTVVRTFPELQRVGYLDKLLDDHLKSLSGLSDASAIAVQCLFFGMDKQFKAALERRTRALVHAQIHSKFANQYDVSVLASVDQFCKELAGQLMYPDYEWETPMETTITAYAHETLALLKISELFQQVVAWPKSKPSLTDTYAVLKSPSLRAMAVKSFQTSANMLFNNAYETKDLLVFYLRINEAFAVLDPRGVLLGNVSAPIQSYLQNRPDLQQSIIGGLLGEPSSPLSWLALELEQWRRPGTDYCPEGADISWIPEPIDAPPDFEDQSSRNSLNVLLSIQDSNRSEQFAQGLAQAIKERVMRCWNDKQGPSSLKALIDKLVIRFGTKQMINVNVMNNDIAMSLGQFDLDQNVPVYPLILNKNYWPDINEREVLFPDFLPLPELSSVTLSYKNWHPRQDLQWLTAEGVIVIEVKFNDRIVKLELSPTEVLILSQFDERSAKSEWTAVELASNLKLKLAEVNQTLSMFVQKKVLGQTASGTYYPLSSEKTSSTTAIESEQAAQSNDDTAPMATQSTLEVKLKPLVKKMLSNLGPMTPSRLFDFVGMLVRADLQNEPNFDFVEFMARLAQEGFISESNGIFST